MEARHDPDPPRVLVVDDEPAPRRVAERALRRAGFDCETADDGAAALDRLAAGRFDVVLTDLRMPTVSGHMLCVEVLAAPDPPAVLVLTAVVDPALRADLLDRGVARILAKPASPRRLAEAVAAAVDAGLDSPPAAAKPAGPPAAHC